MNFKKVLIPLGIATGAILLKLLNDASNAKYSDKWFDTVSDDEFYAEREPIRKLARENGGDANAEALLQRFNREETRRLNEKYLKTHPNSKPRSREHGWYLPNDD